MPNVIQKITYAKQDGESWGTNIELVTAIPQETVIGWGSQKDASSFKISKADKFFDSQFEEVTPDLEENGLVRIYMAKNKPASYEFTNDDLLFEGVIDTLPQQLNTSGNIATVNMFNFVEVYFDVEIPYYGRQLNFIEHARALLRELNRAGTIVEWDTDNPTTKEDGSSFPQKDLALDYTPSFVIMDRLVGTDFTEDGQYYWYLSKGSVGKRKLSIRKKNNTIQGTIDDSLPIQTISIDKGKDSVVNYIIFNCGTDFYGNSVESFVFDASSIGKHGWKTEFIIDETGQLFSGLHSEEVTQNRSQFTFDAQGNLSNVYPSSYPYTFHFDSTVTAANDVEFNDQIRIRALVIGENYANSVLNQLSKTQYIVNINMPFSNAYVVGGLYSFDLQRLRTFDKQLRLKNITYTINGITLSFDQDEKDRT